jgi:hypothetical protein
MKKRIIAVFVLICATPVISAQSEPAKAHSYPFALYPAGSVYKGKPAPLRFGTRAQREFRNVLRDGARKGPNFAGHYTVVEWGCGSNCVVFALVDELNGTIYDRDMPPTNDAYPCGLLYKTESMLFVIEQSATISSPCEAKLYRWNGSHFVPIISEQR